MRKWKSTEGVRQFDCVDVYSYGSVYGMCVLEQVLLNVCVYVRFGVPVTQKVCKKKVIKVIFL